MPAPPRLVALRDAWLNPPDWTERVPKSSRSALTASPYPERIVAKAGIEEQLAKRTLTNLYNQRPAWLAQAHEALDTAIRRRLRLDRPSAMPDEEILRRLLER
ncbi:MAG: hypothetical protein U1F49_20000 [Rubrivivax sp.]